MKSQPTEAYFKTTKSAPKLPKGCVDLPGVQLIRDGVTKLNFRTVMNAIVDGPIPYDILSNPKISRMCGFANF